MPRAVCLFALSAQIIVVHCYRAVSVDRDVRGLVKQKVVSGALSDDSEVVYGRRIELAIL
jgi:hypothetical protein